MSDLSFFASTQHRELGVRVLPLREQRVELLLAPAVSPRVRRIWLRRSRDTGMTGFGPMVLPLPTTRR